MSVSWGEYSNAIIGNGKAKRIPLVAQFELTSRCNLSCRMCYVCSKSNLNEVIKKEKSADEWIELAKRARDAGVLFLLLTGGEVLLRPDFKEIYEAVSEMGFCLQIYTNGTLITPEIAEWLGKRPPSKVGITLYGASGETYKKITGSESAFEKAVNGIDLLRKQNITVTIRTTTVRGNREDAKKIFDIAYERGILFEMGQYISPRREGTDSDPISERLTYEEIKEFNKDLRNYIDEKSNENQQKKNQDETHKEIDINTIIEKVGKAHDNSAFACCAGHCSFWVTWDGRMTPCGLMSEPAIDVFNNDFNKVWEELKQQCDMIPKSADCNRCEVSKYCIRCPGRLKTETGSYSKCSSYLRQLTKLNNPIFR